jgi:myosin heavy subunit
MNILVSEGLKDFLFELKFTDNQSILELFEQRPTGIFSLLDEASAIASND